MTRKLEAVNRIEVLLTTYYKDFQGVTDIVADIMHYCTLHDLKFYDITRIAQDYIEQDESFDAEDADNG
jgi:hypothetical protein